jgi:hypothetical protein
MPATDGRRELRDNVNGPLLGLLWCIAAWAAIGYDLLIVLD